MKTKLLTVNQAAAAIGCTPATLRAALRRGAGPAVVILGPKWRRIPASALRDWAAASTPAAADVDSTAQATPSHRPSQRGRHV